MTDREKVIQRLEECLSASCRGFRTCPHSDDPDWDAVRAAMALLKEQEPVEPTWISVKDRMPPNDDTKVLTYGNPVTHWMPLPEPPKEV